MRKITKILALVLTVVMLMSVTAIAASAVATTAPTMVYLTPNTNWKADNARFAIYTWDGGEKWFDMKDTDGDGIFECELPKGIENIIFCRMNPNAEANNWTNKWNQSSDLKYDGSNDHYIVSEGAWDKGAGTWTKFIPAQEGHECVLVEDTTKRVEPTCTENGLKVEDCTAAGCDNPHRETLLSATGHSYKDNVCSVCTVRATYTVAGTGAHLGTEWAPANAANDMTYDEATNTYTKVYTNVAAGSYMLKCAQDHDWGVAYPGTDKSYTVSKAGSTVTVTLKGETVTIDVVAPHEHNYVESVTAPTCTTAGFTTHTCECGDTYKDSEVPATGHTTVLDICMVCFLPQPSIVLGENTVNVPESGSAFGMIQITEQDTYQITDAAGAIVCIFTTNVYSEGADFSIAADGTLGASWYAFSTTPVELAPGYYYIGVYGAGEHKVTLAKYEAPEADSKPIVNVSDLEVGTTTGEELIAGTGISASAGLAIDENGKSIDGFEFTKRLKLGGTMKVEEGVVKAGLQIVTNGPAKIVLYAISSSSSDSTRTLQLATLVDGALNKLAETSGVLGDAVAKYELTVDAAGTYYIGSTKSGINIYYIAVEEEASEVPAEQILVVGDNTLSCTESTLVGDLGPYVFIKFTVEEDGHYKFTSDKLAAFTIFTTEINAEGADFSTGGVSWTAYVNTEADLAAGTYWVGINYFAGYGDYTITLEKHEHSFTEGKCECGAEDPNYVPPHEHEFVEGKCECGETDPEYVAPEQPPVDEPTQPAEPTGFLAQLMAFFQMIIEFFKNLFKF